jgi:drug/metabolite transporter (DMT)-like permease
MSQKKLIYLIMGILIAWGLSWPIMKISLQYIPPIWLGALRMFVGAVFLFLILSIKKERLLPNKQDWSVICVIALLQMSLFNMFLNLGLQRVEASRGVILVFTTPLWITPYAILYLKEKLHYLTILGLTFGFIGMVLLLNPFTLNWSDTETLLGDLFLVLTALCWATAIIYVSLIKMTSSPLKLAPWQMLLSSIFLVGVALVCEPRPSIQWTLQFGLLMIYLGPVATAFGYWGVIEMSRQLKPVTMSLTMLGVPLIGFISSAYFLKEPLTLIKIAALASLLVGLVCVGLAKRNQKPATTVYQNEPI